MRSRKAMFRIVQSEADLAHMLPEVIHQGLQANRVACHSTGRSIRKCCLKSCGSGNESVYESPTEGQTVIVLRQLP